MTEVHGFFGWWKKIQAAKTKPQVADNVALLDDAVRNFQLENYGLTIPVGTTYTLKVKENPTTGYTWNISDETKAAFEKFFTVEKTYVQSKDPDCVGCTGVGGQASFTITAVAPGTATFAMTENRPWEKDQPPVNSRSISITVV